MQAWYPAVVLAHTPALIWPLPSPSQDAVQDSAIPTRSVSAEARAAAAQAGSKRAVTIGWTVQGRRDVRVPDGLGEEGTWWDALPRHLAQRG